VLQSFDLVAGRLAAVPGIAPDGNAPAPASVAATVAAGIGPSAGSRREDAPALGRSGAPAGPRSVPERLRELNQLRADGLITEAEYLELRRKILAGL
jgi:hypothetical protein